MYYLGDSRDFVNNNDYAAYMFYFNFAVNNFCTIYICDRICKKGSYTRTTLEHRFHHHSMDTLSDNPCVHVLWPTVHQSAFPEAAF